jgi:hypothetical protein
VRQSSSSSLLSQQQHNIGKLEKCTHCGINICNKCLYHNHESSHGHSSHHNHSNNTELAGAAEAGRSSANPSHSHYNTVKKEFKQMYNFSKEIVEKLHLLNNAIKIEESAITELNLIKHKVNTKALEVIKQINQEKVNLIEQIENVKRKYEL